MKRQPQTTDKDKGGSSLRWLTSMVKSATGSLWQHRYIVLTDSHMAYYRDEEQANRADSTMRSIELSKVDDAVEMTVEDAPGVAFVVVRQT